MKTTLYANEMQSSYDDNYGPRTYQVSIIFYNGAKGSFSGVIFCLKVHTGFQLDHIANNVIHQIHVVF